MKRWILAALLLPFCLFPLSASAQTSSSASPLFNDALEAFKKEDYVTARALFETIIAQNPRDPAAQNYLKLIAAKEKGGGGTGIEAGLRKVIIPKVDFVDATVRDAITYVSQQVKALSGGKQGMNIVWMIPADYAAKVTLSLQNVPASEVMKYIAQSGQLTLEYDAYAVKVKPANP